MESLVSASLLEQQAPPATNFLPFPRPNPNSNPNLTARSGPPAALSLPPLPPSLTSFTALQSLHSSLNPTGRLGFPSTDPSPPAVFGLAPFAGLSFPTSSHLARHDQPLSSPLQQPGSDPSVSIPTNGRRTTYNIGNNNSTPLTTPAFPHTLRQHTHLSWPPASTSQSGMPTFSLPSTDRWNDFQQQARLQEPNGDDLLEALATGHFSSPSLPPHSPQSPTQPQRQAQRQLQQHREQLFYNLDPARASHNQPLPAISTYFPPAYEVSDPEGTSVDLAEVELEEQGRGTRNDSDKITVDSLLLDMPATRAKRSRAGTSSDNPSDGPSTNKRQRLHARCRTATAQPASSKGQVLPSQPSVTVPDSDSADSIFEDNGEDVSMFDLTKSDDGVPQELLGPKEDQSIKLAKFECIICMDTATHLTVTHCGHLFCAQCLHQAMHTEVTKKVCPMCRQKLEPRPKDGREPNAKAKTFFHLELKLMPSKRQGKQPAQC